MLRRLGVVRMTGGGGLPSVGRGASAGQVATHGAPSGLQFRKKTPLVHAGW